MSRSRIIPFNHPSWDYSLWESIKSQREKMQQEEMDYIALRDGTGSSNEDYWTTDGRSTSSGRVIDFIGLSSNFDNLDQAPNLRESIIEDFERRATRIGGRKLLDFSSNSDDWLEVNWPILAKVVGAAIASCGREQGFWRTSGKDARQSHKFWSEMKREGTLDKSGKGTYLEYENWQKLVEGFREHRLDPSAAVLRGQSHPPSTPVIIEGNRYFQNPIAIDHRVRMRGGWDTMEEQGPFHEYHGSLTFEVIRKATVSLSKGKISDFLWCVHGLCAYHVMREEGLIQHKIGLHLVTNLAIRRMTRKVGCLPVPDIAKSLDTSFNLGPVLKILHDAGLIDWYTVDVSIVEAAIAELQNR